MQCIPSWSLSLQARSKTSTTSAQALRLRHGPTNNGALPARPTERQSAPSRATAYKPWIAPQPTGAPSSKPIGTPCTTTAKSSTSMSSTLSSAVLLPTISTTKMSNKKRLIKVEINLEHMSPDELMRFFIRLADKGLLPPCPPEIRQKYEPKP